LLIPAALLGAFVAAPPANAGFSVCNKTTHPASVALGYYDGAEWSSAGWWNIVAGSCAELITTPLPARYYYLYAVHQDVGGAWDGDRSFCVSKDSFRIKGRSDCLALGHEVRRFFQVDTGNSPDWTENLAD
jgi:uncharacterized membrane protein